MNEILKKYIDPIKRFWNTLNKKSKTILACVAGFIFIAAVVAAVLLNQTQYVVLYPGMARDEAVQVMNELQSRGIDYYEKNGNIYVPKTDENSLRMELANLGYPKTTNNYDYFTENIDIMTTDYEKKIIEKYQLNQRLEAVIETLKPIKEASVTISIPEESGYAWDENKTKPSASVTVEMLSGQTLEPAQVNGIKQLVAKSVPSLDGANVAVINTATGEELEGADLTSQTNISKFKMEIEELYEDEVKKKVLNVLTPLYGADNVNVAVKAVMDIDKKIQEIITYQPSNENTGVLSEAQTSNEQTVEGSSTGGVVGSETNSDVTTYPGITVDGNTIYSADTQSYKYLVSQVKQQIQGDAASIKDMTVSVVINKEILDEARKAELGRLIANAAAIVPEKVVIYNSAFWQAEVVPLPAPDVEDLFSIQNLIIAGAGLVILLLLLLVLMLILKKRKKKKLDKLQIPALDEDPKKKKAEEVWQESSVESDAQDELIQVLREQQESEDAKVNQQIQEFSSQNPEIVAQLIRGWLKGEQK
ncbi:MAG: flagellar basal-body MS-ring/collar protein FliF [Clostridia bacterium]|nr:flagellar basal-body MS-ring/collar protein FliF [Clostridia bacterium]